MERFRGFGTTLQNVFRFSSIMKWDTVASRIPGIYKRNLLILMHLMLLKRICFEINVENDMGYFYFLILKQRVLVSVLSFSSNIPQVFS